MHRTTRRHAVHIAFHDTARVDELLLSAVRPLFAELPGVVTGASFARHWLRGPHVRLHLDIAAEAAADEAEAQVRPLVERVVGGYLARHPSTARLDHRDVAPVHERLAVLEQERGPLTPWFPDNSIHYLPYDPRLHVLGTVAAADALAEFQSDATPLAFDVLAGTTAGRERLDALAGLMIATAHVGCPPLTKGYISYRSHAEGFFANAADSTGLRARFDRVYEANRLGLAQRIDDVVATVDATRDGEERDADGALAFVVPWSRLVRRHQQRIEALVAAGAMPLPDPLPAAARGEAAPGSAWSRISDFHRALYGNDNVRGELRASWFTVYRVLLNYQYLFFTRLGLAPVERFMLCHLVARAVEDRAGVSLPMMISFLQDGVAVP